jgi:hypothetical protein
MSMYTPNKIQFPTGLDELGLKFGLLRFQSEDLDSYRRRIYLENRQPSGPTAQEFARSTSRKVGLFDIPVLEIDLKLDGSGIPLATDPLIKVTASKLYAWSDYANSVLDFELLLTDRDEAYFLRDVRAAFAASTYFSVTSLDDYNAYLKSSHLQVASNLLHLEVPQLQNRLVHDFGVQHLREVRFSDVHGFAEEVTSLDDLESTGQFYVDYQNGCVFNYDPMGGLASVDYVKFPYQLWWQPVRTYEFLDDDLKYIAYDNLLDEDGEETPLLLNSLGAKMIDEVLSVHPLEWGK